jgi:hypothetical protein
MFEILFNGTHYLVAAIGAAHAGWVAIGSAGTLEEGYMKSKKDWITFGASVTWSRADRSGLLSLRQTSSI